MLNVFKYFHASLLLGNATMLIGLIALNFNIELIVF